MSFQPREGELAGARGAHGHRGVGRPRHDRPFECWRERERDTVGREYGRIIDFQQMSGDR